MYVMKSYIRTDSKKMDVQYEEIFILTRNETRERMTNIALAIKPQIPGLEAIPER